MNSLLRIGISDLDLRAITIASSDISSGRSVGLVHLDCVSYKSPRCKQEVFITFEHQNVVAL